MVMICTLPLSISLKTKNKKHKFIKESLNRKGRERSPLSQLQFKVFAYSVHLISQIPIPNGDMLSFFPVALFQQGPLLLTYFNQVIVSYFILALMVLNCENTKKMEGRKAARSRKFECEIA
ncbi:hypothetical protein LINPERHAP2_LOCUS41429 [Linum perenne]